MSKLLSNIPIMQPLLEGLPILLLSLAAGCHPAPAAADPLASPPVAGYPALAGPYDRSGLAARYTERTTAHCGFFVRVQSYALWRAVRGDLRVYRCQLPVCQPRTVRHHGCLAASGDGFIPHSWSAHHGNPRP